jgi:hypothetical protein
LRFSISPSVVEGYALTTAPKVNRCPERWFACYLNIQMRKSDGKRPESSLPRERVDGTHKTGENNTEEKITTAQIDVRE